MEIPLNGKKGEGKVAIIDDEDFDKVKKYKWYFAAGGYVIGEFGKENVRMHRVIMNPDAGMVIDHLNHNPLDNRKKNLRVCTYRENNLNRRFKHYYYDKTSNRWIANVKINGKNTKRSYKSEDAAKNAVRLMKSGAIPRCNKNTKEHAFKLPKYIYQYMYDGKFHGYMFQYRKNGISHRKRGLKTLSEATSYKKDFFDKINVNILRKENI